MNRLLRCVNPAVAALLLVCLPHLLLVLATWHSVPLEDGMPTGPSDPDSWLRLTLVREWLQGGGWYNHGVAGSNAPWGGTTSPWTRPLDLVIAAFTNVQPTAVDLTIRLARAALLLPVLWMALLLAGIHRLIRLLNPVPSAYLMASLLIATTPIVWNYFGMGNADHHAPLAVLFVWALGCVLTPLPSRRLVMLTGMLLSLQLWISVEALILIAAIYLWYGLHWLKGDGVAARVLPWLATSIACMAAIAMMIERPVSAWWVPVYDSISVVYVFVLCMAALYAWVLVLANPVTMRSRMVLTGTGAVVVLMAIHAVYPLVFHGPMAQVDPYIFTDFLPRVSEAKALWHSPLPLVLGMLLQPLAAIALCGWSWRQAGGLYPRASAAPLLFFLLVTTVLYIGQVRWSYYLYPLVAVALAPILGALFSPNHANVRGRWPARWLEHHNEHAQMLRRVPALFICILLPLGFILLAKPYSDAFTSAENIAAAKRSQACDLTARRVIYSGGLNSMAGGRALNMFASTNVGAELLFWTPHHIVASNYHREGPGIRYVWEAYNITDMATLQRYLAQRHIQALLLCPEKEPVNGSALQALQHGAHPPAWLVKVPYTVPASQQAITPVDGSDPALFLVTRVPPPALAKPPAIH